jgi:pyridoxine 5-phosphate synthase
MGNTPEILAFAIALRPKDVCLVPEEREEITTEGGLDCVKNESALAPSVCALRNAGITVSLFIDPEPVQVEAAVRLGAQAVELHTGAFANASTPDSRDKEFLRLERAAVLAHEAGLTVNAGHGINYENVSWVRRLPHLHELNIGHSIVSRSVFVGFQRAVREMLEAMNPAAAT